MIAGHPWYGHIWGFTCAICHEPGKAEDANTHVHAGECRQKWDKRRADRKREQRRSRHRKQYGQS